MYLSMRTQPQQTQNICITFVQRRPNVFDVGPTLYNCYTNVLCLLGRAVGTAQLGIHTVSSRSLYTAVQRPKTVSAYFTSKQILPFAFTKQHIRQNNPAKKTEVPLTERIKRCRFYSKFTRRSTTWAVQTSISSTWI